MNDAAVQDLRTKFLRILPDFRNFESPPPRLSKGELDYKREASRRARSILGEYVDGQRDFSTDDEARKILLNVIDLTNFLNWRDKTYLIEQLFVEEGDWIKCATLVLRCLRRVEAGAWQPPLNELLDWLKTKDCSANITKILPTYFLFLWDPKEHFCIKSRFVDNFLKQLGAKPLGQGRPLTVEGYQHVLQTCQNFRETISDWKPKDNIDVHSLAWLGRGARSYRNRDARTDDG